MQNRVQIRNARLGETSVLTEIAMTSKASWGYPPQFMDAYRKVLTLDYTYLEKHPAFVAEFQGDIGGFATLKPINGHLVLDFLFIRPDLLKKGIGRVLWDEALKRTHELGYDHFHIASDPNAVGFYLKMGAYQVGWAPSEAFPLVMLPVLKAEISPAQRTLQVTG